MIRKSMPSGYDPMGGNRFSEKIMLKKSQSMIRTGRHANAAPVPAKSCAIFKKVPARWP
jgi:hypothetical protein